MMNEEPTIEELENIEEGMDNIPTVYDDSEFDGLIALLDGERFAAPY